MLEHAQSAALKVLPVDKEHAAPRCAARPAAGRTRSASGRLPRHGRHGVASQAGEGRADHKPLDICSDLCQVVLRRSGDTPPEDDCGGKREGLPQVEYCSDEGEGVAQVDWLVPRTAQ